MMSKIVEKVKLGSEPSLNDFLFLRKPLDPFLRLKEAPLTKFKMILVFKIRWPGEHDSGYSYLPLYFTTPAKIPFIDFDVVLYPS